jgi:hypothetical protein
MYIWEIKPNDPEDWPQHLITVINGRRNIDKFIEGCSSSPKAIKHNVSAEESIAKIIKILNLNDTNLANTITVFCDNNINIQYCFHQDYVETYPNKLENVYNYFTSIITSDVFSVCGNAVFIKTDNNNNLLDLSEEELFSILANIYFLKSYQVLNGELSEITFINITSHINKALGLLKLTKLANWEFYYDKEVGDLGFKKVDINNYNGLIILKRKELNDIAKNYIIEDSDSRGVYEDLNENIVNLLFL